MIEFRKLGTPSWISRDSYLSNVDHQLVFDSLLRAFSFTEWETERDFPETMIVSMSLPSELSLVCISIFPCPEIDYLINRKKERRGDHEKVVSNCLHMFPVPGKINPVDGTRNICRGP
jgi:hypothetical protein